MCINSLVSLQVPFFSTVPASSHMTALQARNALGKLGNQRAENASNQHKAGAMTSLSRPTQSVSIYYHIVTFLNIELYLDNWSIIQHTKGVIPVSTSQLRMAKKLNINRKTCCSHRISDWITDVKLKCKIDRLIKINCIFAIAL